MTNPRLAITITADGKQAEQAADRVGQAFGRVEGSATRAADATTKAGDSMARFLAASLTAGGITALAAGYLKAADAVTGLNNSLKLATGSAVEAGRAYAALFDIAQRSRVSFTDLGATFGSISRAGEALGLSQSRLLGVTESIGNAIAIAGGSAASAQAGLTQLAQGLASGVLRGDEFNSVVEQTPRLAKALADGLNVPIGQLRKMAEEGKLTSEAVIKALESQSEVLRGEMAGSVLTVGQAWVQLQNATTKAVGELDSATGTSATVAAALSSLAGTVGNLGDTMRQNAGLIGAVLGGAGALASAAAIARVGTAITVVRAAFIALSATMAANPVGLVLLGVGALVGAGLAAGEAHAKSLKGLSEEVERTSERIENAERKLRAAGGSRGALTAGLEQHLQELKQHRAKVLQEVEAIKQAEAQATGASSAGAGRGDVNPQTVGQVMAAEQALAAKRAEWLGKYATDSEKLAAKLKEAREAFGGVIPPDIESRIRASFIKPIKDSSLGLEAARDDAKAWADTWSDFTKIQADVLAATEQLTPAQKRLVEWVQSPAFLHASDAMRALAMAQFDAAFAAEQAAAAEKAAAEVTKEQTKLNQELGRAFADAFARQRDAAEASAKTAADRLTALEDEATAAALAEAFNLSLSESIERVAMARLEDAKAKAIADGNQARADAIQAEIETREKLVKALAAKEARDATKKAREQEAAEWAKTWEQVGQSLTDQLMEGGKNGAEYVRGLFRSMILRPIIMGSVQGVLGWAGLGGQASGGSGGAGGIAQAQQWAQMAQAGSKAWGWVTGSGSAAGAGTAGTAGASGTAGSAAGAGSMSWAGWALAIALGIKKASSDYSEGFRRGQARDVSKKYGYGVGGYEADLATGLSKLGVSDRWADLLSGSTAVAKIFGYASPRATDAGIVGTLSGAGDSFQQFTDVKQRGGLLRKSKTWTETAALDAGMSSGISAGAQGIRRQVGEYLDALGLASSGVAAFSYNMRVSLKGLDAKGQQAAITAALSGYGEALVSAMFARVDEFKREGETAGATLARLAGSLRSVNDSIDALGMSALSASVDGAAAAQQLADLFGGTDGLSGAVSSFMSKFYSEAEQTAAKSRQVAREFERMGEVMPATKEEFRALVESQDLSTASGREAYRALLGVSDAFASVADASKTAADQAIKQAAATDELAATAADAARMRAGTLARGSGTIVSSGFAVPGFAAGGAFAGGLRMVGEGGPELEITGPSHISNASSTAAMMGALQALPALMQAVLTAVEGLREENRVQALQIAANTNKAARILEQVTPSGTFIATGAPL